MLKVLQIMLAAPVIDRRKIWNLLRIYSSLDRDVCEFQAGTGLRCFSGCGHCCENPAVETSVLEVLPLAVELSRRKEGEKYLARLTLPETYARCVFYQDEISSGGCGHCRMYALRPAICRLFGFSVRGDKYGRKEIITCSRIKQESCDRFQKANALIVAGLPVVDMAAYARRILAIDFSLGEERIPINQAVKSALERVGFEKQIEKERKKK